MPHRPRRPTRRRSSTRCRHPRRRPRRRCRSRRRTAHRRPRRAPRRLRSSPRRRPARSASGRRWRPAPSAGSCSRRRCIARSSCPTRASPRPSARAAPSRSRRAAPGRRRAEPRRGRAGALCGGPSAGGRVHRDPGPRAGVHVRVVAGRLGAVVPVARLLRCGLRRIGRALDCGQLLQRRRTDRAVRRHPGRHNPDRRRRCRPCGRHRPARSPTPARSPAPARAPSPTRAPSHSRAPTPTPTRATRAPDPPSWAHPRSVGATDPASAVRGRGDGRARRADDHRLRRGSSGAAGEQRARHERASKSNGQGRAASHDDLVTHSAAGTLTGKLDRPVDDIVSRRRTGPAPRPPARLRSAASGAS